MPRTVEDLEAENLQLKSQLSAAIFVLRALKYYGDGMRWFNRRGGSIGGGSSRALATAILNYEKQFATIDQLTDDEYAGLIEQEAESA